VTSETNALVAKLGGDPAATSYGVRSADWAEAPMAASTGDVEELRLSRAERTVTLSGGADTLRREGFAMIRRAGLVCLGAALALVLPLWSATPAVAATIAVTPSVVPAGGQVTISGDVLADGTPGCTVPGAVTLISPAFAGLGEFAGTPATTAQADAAGNFTTTVTISASVASGTYDVTGRCGGGNLGVTGTLTVTPAPILAQPPFTG
jgi:hypothetical protein